MPVEMSPQLIMGQLLNGRYRVLSPLGEGGMGQTFIAEDTQRPSNPRCVVKQLKPVSAGPDVLSNIKRLFNGEAEVLDRLGHHDQIPALLAYFDQGQEFYLVQEFIDGHPLSQELPLGQRCPETQVLQILEDILQILEFVHSQNTIHRDIKPDNLIRRHQDGKLVLIDFGAVKQLRLHSSTAIVQMSKTVGIVSPGYTPTEQSRGTPRPSSDLYALGMVAIQALTGLSPTLLREDDEGETIWRDQAEVSDELANFLTTMVQYHFKQRYKTATEALQALRQITQTSTQTVSEESAINQENPASYSSTKIDPSYTNSEQAFTDFEIPIPNSASQMFSRKAVPAQPNSEDEESESFPPARSLKSRLLIGGLVVTLTGLVAGGSYWVHRSMERQEQQEKIEQIEQLKSSGDYPQCISQLETVSGNHEDILVKAKTLLNECKTAQARLWIVEAKKLAIGNSFLGAVSLLKQITPDLFDYAEAQELINEWSESVLKSAENQFQNGEIDTATAWARSIPEGNPAYEKAQEKIRSWQRIWQQNEDALNAAQTALNDSQWEEAIANLDKLTLKFWKEQGQPIRARAQDEKILGRAQALSDQSKWSAAIEEAKKVTTEQGKTKADEIIKNAEELRRRYLHPINNVSSSLSMSLPSQSYPLEGQKGDRFQLTLSSTDFDTIVSLIDEAGQEVAWNDDSQGGTNSTLTVRLPQTGTYQVRVSSYGSSGYGRFTLDVRRIRR